MWGLGCLVWESYNGPLRNRASLKDINNVRVAFKLIIYCYKNTISNKTRFPNP